MIRTAAALALGLAALSACGLRGDLERPVPLWGNPPNEGENDPRTIRAREEEAARQAAAEAAADAARDASPTVESPRAAEPGEPELDATPPQARTP